MKEHDFKFYNELRTGSISLNNIPKSVKNTSQFQTLLSSKILATEKSGRGSKVYVKNTASFEAFFSKYFSEEEVFTISKSSNIKKLRDSKARKTKASSVFFLRGFIPIVLNGENLDLCQYTNSFGLFSVKEPIIVADKICFVENLDSFLNAEKLFGESFIFLHKYGRIGIDSLKNISASEILVFVDYDFNGLDEYLRIKNVYDTAMLFIPENFDDLFENYSKTIDGGQQQSERVSSSNLTEVIRIRELVSRTNRFLEQEILTHG